MRYPISVECITYALPIASVYFSSVWCVFVLVKIDNLIAYAFGEFFLSVIATLSNGDNVVKYPRILP